MSDCLMSNLFLLETVENGTKKGGNQMVHLKSCIREYKKDSLLAPFYVSLEVIMEVLIPIMMANLIDFGIDEGNLSYILKCGLALVLASLFSLLFGVIAGKKAANASSGFAKNLRMDMYERIQMFSFSNIDRYSTASIVTRLTTDVSNVQNAYQMLIRVAMRSPIMLIFSLVACFNIDAKLAWIYVIAIPILGIGLFIIMQKAHPIFERVFKTYDKLNNVVQENLHGIRVVKSFVREPYEDEKFANISSSIYRDFSNAEKTLAFNSPLMQFCMYGCMLLVSWFGARAVVASGNVPSLGLSTGELMSMFTYATQILMSLMMLSMVFVMIIMSRASVERIREVLVEESDIQNPKDPVMKVKDGTIEFDHVRFAYSTKADEDCLHDICVSIRSGEMIGIIGGTGSGKSTFVSLIPRLYDVLEGSVRVGGVDVRQYDMDQLRDAIGVVLQKNTLFSGTIKENLRWGNETASDEDLIHACKLSQADGFIQEFPDGYDTYIEQGGSNVSGGQKQRLCIARALLKKPKVLILDDSTSAVDTKTDAYIRQAFASEIPDTTKIIVAQRISSIQEADRIIVLDGGSIHAIGTHEELLKTCAIYQEVFASQQKGEPEHEG